MAIQKMRGVGHTHAATLSVSDTPDLGDTALNNILIQSTGILQWNATIPWGRPGFMVEAAAPSGSVSFGGYSGFSVTSLRIWFYFWLTAYPTATTNQLSVRAAAKTASWGLTTTGQVIIQNAAPTTVKTYAGGSVPLNTLCRGELLCSKGTTTANGRIAGGWFVGDETVMRNGETFYDQAGNGGTANLQEFRLGKGESSAWAGSFFWGDMGVDTVGTTMPGGPEPAGGTWGLAA